MAVEQLKSVWRYREFILSSVKREFQSKYQGSLLGSAWTVLNPMAMVFVYAIVFSQIMQARLPDHSGTFSYSIYLCAGILTWGLFSEIVGRGQSLYLEHANIIKKLKFPIGALPAIMLLTACLNFAIIFAVFIAFLLLSGNFPGWNILWFFPVCFVQLIFSMGLGLSLGVLNVFFRDVGQLFTIILQFWFWLTPIVYPAEILPDIVAPFLLKFNPMAGIIQSYQSIFVHSAGPQWSALLFPLVLGLALCWLAVKLFGRYGDEIVDEL